MDYNEEYLKKLLLAEDAAKLVKSGDYVVFTPGREARAIGLALASRKEELQGVKLYLTSPGFDFGWYDPGWNDSFEVTIAFPTATCQESLDAKLCDFSPLDLIPFRELEYAPIPDVVLTEVSPPDELGFCSFGNSVWNKKSLIRRAKLSIAETNPRLIRTYGDNYIHISEIDHFVKHVPSGAEPGVGSLAGRELKPDEPYPTKEPVAQTNC